MKLSRRSRRMARHHARKRPFLGFNLVSLMDIFTILVFFLLVNSSDVEVLPSTKSVKLPESVADKKPKENVIVLVNDTDILVQGRKVVSVASVEQSQGLIIGSLKTELARQAQKSIARRTPGQAFNGEVTIMGDKDIPFELLKKIMATCSHSRYGNISLAVMHKIGQKG